MGSVVNLGARTGLWPPEGDVRARPSPGLQNSAKRSQGGDSDLGDGFGWILSLRYKVFIRLQV